VQVTVHYPQGRQQLVTYRQAFTSPTSRHCCNCFRLVEGCCLPQDAVLQGSLDLFCSLDCERLFFIKNSSSEWLTAGLKAVAEGLVVSFRSLRQLMMRLAYKRHACMGVMWLKKKGMLRNVWCLLLLLLPGGIRRALFKLERGVCQSCGLDCHALVQQLQQISKDTPGWQAQRRAVVAHRAPAFLQRGCTAYLDKLLDQVGRCLVL
jgi:hypothetical protein